MKKAEKVKKEEEIFNIDKEKDFADWYNTIMKVADLVDMRYNVKGFIVHRPWLMRMVKILYSIWEAELEKTNHEPCLFPVVIPEENFKKEAEHVKGFAPEVFWVTAAGDNKLNEKLALRPTSETAMYQMYSLWVRSYRDLPFKRYQSCAVYRYETKMTKPLLRGREFLWIESHDVFRTKEEAMAQVKEDMGITEKVVHEQLGVPFIFFERPQWDKFKGAEFTYASDSLLPDKKIIQLPSTHYLGQRFGRAFNIKYEDERGKKDCPHQTCYGPPIWRALASAMSLHGDNKGLVLPFSIAPYQIVIVPILFEETRKQVLEKAEKLSEELKQKGFRVYVDDSDKRPGEKYYYWEMKGVPIRLEVGPKEIKSKEVVLVRREDGRKKNVKIASLENEIKKTADDLLKTLKKKADEFIEKNIRKASSLKELAKTLNKYNGFVKVNFCSNDMDGIKCAEVLKEKTGAVVRGTRFGKSERASGNCIVCNKKAKVVVYAGKDY